jgi:hypothetical protein
MGGAVSVADYPGVDIVGITDCTVLFEIAELWNRAEFGNGR